MKRFIYFVLAMALMPVSVFASRDSTSTDTTVVAPFSQGSKTRKVLLVRAGGWISAIGRVEVDTLKSRSGATIVLQGNFTDAAGTQQNFSHVQIDSLSSDSLTSVLKTTLLGVVNITPSSGTWNLANVTTTVDKDSSTAAITSGTAILSWGRLDSINIGPDDFTVAPTQNISAFGGGTFQSNGAGSYVVGIYGSAGAATFQLANNTSGSTNSDGSLFVQSGLDLLLINRESGDIIFRTADIFRGAVDQDGNWSFGTDTSPNGKVHIVGAGGAASGAAYATNPVLILEDAGDQILQFASDGGNHAYINFGDSDSDVGQIEYNHVNNQLSMLAGAGGKGVVIQPLTSIANGDSLSLTDNFLATPEGVLWVFNADSSVNSEFVFTSSAGVTEIRDFGNKSSATKGTASSVNVYYSSVNAKFYIENLLGAARVFKLVYIGG